MPVNFMCGVFMGLPKSRYQKRCFFNSGYFGVNHIYNILPKYVFPLLSLYQQDDTGFRGLPQ